MITALSSDDFSGGVTHLPPCGPSLIRGCSAGLWIPRGPDIDSAVYCPLGGYWLEAPGLPLPEECGLACLHNPGHVDYTCSYTVVWLHV